MSNTQHTPGPWVTDLLPVEGDKTRKCFVFAGPDDETRKDICDVHNWRGKKQREANARLIAAAPELREAGENAAASLRNLLAQFKTSMTPADYAGRTKVLDALSAALTKAAGESDKPSRANLVMRAHETALDESKHPSNCNCADCVAARGWLA
jgi:hypothetical protein